MRCSHCYKEITTNFTYVKTKNGKIVFSDVFHTDPRDCAEVEDEGIRLHKLVPELRFNK